MSDLVSRQAAIKNAHFPMIDDAGYEVVRVDDILALPSAEPKIGWIPVSERLPEIHDEVLVTAHGEVSIAWLYLDGEWRSNDMPQKMFKDIIAWMPLPEPYREDGEV